MANCVNRLLRDTSGASAIEYAVLAGGIFLSIVLVVPLVGGEVAALFTAVAGGFAP